MYICMDLGGMFVYMYVACVFMQICVIYVFVSGVCKCVCLVCLCMFVGPCSICLCDYVCDVFVHMHGSL